MDEFSVHLMSECVNPIQDCGTEVDFVLGGYIRGVQINAVYGKCWRRMYNGKINFPKPLTINFSQSYYVIMDTNEKYLKSGMNPSGLADE